MLNPKIRTIRGAYEEIKKNDPNTCISLWAIRDAVSTGRIPSIKAGCKYLVTMDNVNAYFSGGEEYAI